MDEQEDTKGDELSLKGEDTSEDEVADTEATDTGKPDEQEQDTLNLEDSEVKAQDKGKAELAREQLVDSWSKKVKSGEKELGDIPEDQQWLKPLVEEQVGRKEPDLDELVERKLSEREQTNRFESLKRELTSLGLSQDQKATLESRYKGFRQKGLSQLDSLEASMEIAGVNPAEQALDSQRYAARLRAPGTYSRHELDPAEVEAKEGFGAAVEKCDPEKTWEQLKKNAGLS